MKAFLSKEVKNMKGDRNNYFSQMPPFPTNMMMFPNYMNDNNVLNLDSKINELEKKIKSLDNRLSILENPYQNNMYQNKSMSQYQTTQNNTYKEDTYMM